MCEDHFVACVKFPVTYAHKKRRIKRHASINKKTPIMNVHTKKHNIWIVKKQNKKKKQKKQLVTSWELLSINSYLILEL